HQEMIAHSVVAILVAAAHLGRRARRRRHLVIENTVAQALRQLDVRARGGKPDLEVADTAIGLRLTSGLGGPCFAVRAEGAAPQQSLPRQSLSHTSRASDGVTARGQPHVAPPLPAL